MLFNRSTSVFRQCLQRKLFATVDTFYLIELQKNFRKNIYEYNQTRNFRNFGHTRRKSRFIYSIPIALCCIGMAITVSFDWQR